MASHSKAGSVLDNLVTVRALRTVYATSNRNLPTRSAPQPGYFPDQSRITLARVERRGASTERTLCLSRRIKLTLT